MALTSPLLALYKYTPQKGGDSWSSLGLSLFIV